MAREMCGACCLSSARLSLTEAVPWEMGILTMPTSRVVRRMDTPSWLNCKLCLDREALVEVPLPARGCWQWEGWAFPNGGKHHGG